jgi:hypothetical protein
MNEKPRPLGARAYQRHRAIIKKAARKLRVSEGEVVGVLWKSSCSEKESNR